MSNTINNSPLLAMSAPIIFRDAWAKRDAWRKHPVFARSAMVRSMFPGFGIGLAAFTAYVAYDTLFSTTKKDDHHH
jgi:NADH dehydrogenase (ubiquinone) 1 beta subcomplex subunit 3